MAIDLRQMRHALMLAEHGSFARAAVALRLSQPALTRSIQALERQVGGELFLRSAAGVVPTDVGRLFIQRARQVLQLAEDLDQEVISNRALKSGLVTVGGGPYPAESTLSAALTRFISAYPHVNVRLQVRDWDELLRRLRTRELDFFVAEISTMQSEPDLDIEPMAEHALYFVARKDHPLASRARVTPTDTFSFPFISPARIPPRVLEPMLAAQRKADPTAAARAFPSVECNSLAAVKRIVAGSNAITAATLQAASSELESGTFALLGREPWLTVRYGVVVLKGHPLSTAAMRLREFVTEAEHAVSVEEKQLLKRWMPGRASRKPPVRRDGRAIRQ
jgi:DNA-binding transcriptional LysR family regulator